MFAILSQLLFFLGLAIIIFLVARKIPKITAGLDSEGEQPLEVQIENHIGKSFFRIPWDKLDNTFEKLVEKLMRRIHILILKLETLLQKKLESFKNKKKEKSSFIQQVNGEGLKKEEPEVIDLSNIDLDNLENLTNSENDVVNYNKSESFEVEETINGINEEKIVEENTKKVLNSKRSKKQN